MNETRQFHHQLNRLRRLILLHATARLILAGSAFGLGAYTLAEFVTGVWHLPVRAHPLFPPIFLSVTVGGAVLDAFLTRPRLHPLFIELDRRLKLHDQLSTAHEYATQPTPSIFTRLLFTEAGRRLAQLRYAQVFPFAWSILHVLLHFAWFLWQRLPMQASDAPDARTSVQRAPTPAELLPSDEAATDFRHVTPPPIPQEPVAPTPRPPDEIAARDALPDAGDPSLKSVESDQTASDGQTGTASAAAQINTVAVQQVPRANELAAAERELLQQLLQDLAQGRNPAPDEWEAGSQDQNYQADNMAPNGGDDGETDGESDETGNSGDQGAPNERRATARGQQGQPTAETPQTDGQDQSQQGGQDDGNTFSTAADLPSGGSDQQGREQAGRPNNATDTSAPGRNKGDGSKYPIAPIQRSHGPVLADTLPTSSQGEYALSIRALTSAGAAAMPAEEMTRPYRQEIESILQQEALPANYREYIKNYFLAIGLTAPSSEEK